MLSVEMEHLNKRHLNCHVYTDKYFIFINYSMYKNVMMKLLSIFGFQNLKQTSGFVAFKIWNKFLLTVYTCRKILDPPPAGRAVHIRYVRD